MDGLGSKTYIQPRGLEQPDGRVMVEITGGEGLADSVLGDSDASQRPII